MTDLLPTALLTLGFVAVNLLQRADAHRREAAKDKIITDLHERLCAVSTPAVYQIRHENQRLDMEALLRANANGPRAEVSTSGQQHDNGEPFNEVVGAQV